MGTYSPHWHREPQNRWMFRNALSKIEDIDSSRLQPADEAVTSDGGYEFICSYNWTKDHQATVFVPGGAPVFRTPPLPASLPLDSERAGGSSAAARAQVPKYPFQAVLDAAAITSPGFRFDQIDVLISRHSMRKLHGFCYGSGARANDFRLNLFVVRRTLIVERHEETPWNIIHGPRAATGSGHSFEKLVSTLPLGLEDSSGHHRVLRYDFGGLSCAVSFETDACYEEEREEGDAEVDEAKAKPSSANSPPFARNGTLEEPAAVSFSTSFAALALSRPVIAHQGGQRGGSPSRNSSSAEQPDAALVIVRGTGTPHSKTAEIKTMSVKGKLKAMPQLWFGRTPYLIVGRHQGGNFVRVAVTKAEDKFAEWEGDEINQRGLRKMVTLLNRLREMTGNAPGKHSFATYEKVPGGGHSPVLQVFSSSDDRKALPDEIIQRVWASEVSS